jgi:hypothetical protein
LETNPYRHTAIDRQHHVDSSFYPRMAGMMNPLKYSLLTEIQGRMQADLIESYLEAHGIDVELFQESIGHHAYPVTVDGLGRVQIFVPDHMLQTAKELLKRFES